MAIYSKDEDPVEELAFLEISLTEDKKVVIEAYNLDLLLPFIVKGMMQEKELAEVIIQASIFYQELTSEHKLTNSKIVN
jgi:hypothetical protein